MEWNSELWSKTRRVAEKAVCYYAHGVVAVDTLVEQMVREWEARCDVDDQPSEQHLLRVAQRLCSCMLYKAWRSDEPDMRNRAFEAMRDYLRYRLHTRYAAFCEHNACAVDDILHQTLETLHLMLTRDVDAGPDEPAAFLKWLETILMRKVYAHLQKSGRDPSFSLEARAEDFVEPEDQRNPDPLNGVLQEELQQAVRDAILSLRNPHYKDVLWYGFLGGMDENELANHLHASIGDIYLWRHRALKALRKNEQVMQELRLLAAS